MIFNYLINLVEGLIISSFTAFYFNINDKLKYISIISLICFLEITVSNYYDSFDQLLIYLLMGTLFISLWILKKKTGFEEIMVCCLAGLCLYLGNIIALSFTSVLFDVSSVEIFASQSLLAFAIVIAKIFSGVIAFLIYIFKMRNNISYSFQTWIIFLFLALSIILVISILFETLLGGVLTSSMTITVLIALMFVCGLFLFLLRKMQKENEEKIKVELLAQKNRFNNENYSRMTVMTEQMKELEHRVSYVLMQVKSCIENNDIENANMIVDQYIKKVKQFDTVLNTKNPYFDFIISRKINEMILEDISLKNTILIDEDDRFNNKDVCELILKCLDLFKENLDDTKQLSLNINKQSHFIIIEIIGKTLLNDIEMPKKIQILIKRLGIEYSINNIENIITLKMIIE